MRLLIVVTRYQRQWLAGLFLGVGALTCGTSAGWASPYIAQLTKPDCTHPLKLTSSDASWVASLLFLGLLLGDAMGAVFQDFIGRKKTLLFTAVPLAVGYALVLAETIAWLFVGRLLCGIAVGCILSSTASFMGEISNPMIRGSAIILIANSLSFGSLLGTVMGGFLPLETFSYICIALTGIFVVLFSLVPESPYYHLARGHVKKAESSLRWFKKDDDVREEMRELQEFLATRSSVGARERLAAFGKRENQKSLAIVLGINAFVHCAGQNTTNSYAESILTSAKIEVTPSVVVMALSFFAIIAGTVALLLVDKVGRKALLMASGLGLGLGHLLLGSHFMMLDAGTDPTTISWLPLVALFLVYFSIPCGLGTMGDTLLGELFPPILKTPASFAFFATTSILSFSISKLFVPYLELVGEKWLFWTFAASALLSVVFSFLVVPDTTRKSLMDIQENLKRDNSGAGITADDVEMNVPGKDVGTNVPGKDVGTNFPDKDAGTNFPDKDVGTNVPDKDVGTNFPDKDVGTDVPDKDVVTNVPDRDVGPNVTAGDVKTDETQSKMP